MEESLLRRVLYEISAANGKEPDGVIPPSREQMIEKMQDAENLLEFLALFGKAIDVIPNIGCITKSGLNWCDKCDKVAGMKHGECIRYNIRQITKNYKQISKKYRIVKTTSDERCIKHTCILPGEFSKEQAEEIVKAYNSKEYKFEEI